MKKRRHTKKKKRRNRKKKRGHVAYRISPNFEYFAELRDLFLKSPPSEKRYLIECIHKLGKIKLAIISGAFLGKDSSDPITVDLFLVGDYIDRRKLLTFLRNREADEGKEVRFATMDTEEFRYRSAMFDRFIRVLLEGPHEKLINKLGIE